ncbi:MAG: prolipoprotein diacylglyceryl transferase [Sumerlaeia bacterium]
MQPVLFQFGSFFIPTYGFLIAIGIMVGLWVASHRAKIRGLPADKIYDLVFIAVLAGFLSARVLYILLNMEEFLQNPMGLILSRSGFVYLGGFFGAVGAMILYMRKNNLPILAMSDILVVSLSIAHGFGRIACHLSGCCFGAVCTVPGLGIQLSPKVIPGTADLSAGPEFFYNAFEEQKLKGWIDAGSSLSLPIWPVQLMESAGLFLLALILWWYSSSKPRIAGQTLSWYIMLYALLRFSLEFLRGDAERGLYMGISTSQWISLFLFPLGLGLLFMLRNNPVSPFSHPSLRPSHAEPEASSKGKRFTSTPSHQAEETKK